MKHSFYIIILLFSLTGCGCLTNNKITECNCSEISFTSLDSAKNCLIKFPENKTSVDKRLFLFAFISTDVKKNQELGWNIINDQDIINTAKKNYLLIIQDLNEFTFPEDVDASLLLERINGHRNEPYFVIVNQALYPFSDWTATEKKDIIIERLGVGVGP